MNSYEKSKNHVTRAARRVTPVADHVDKMKLCVTLGWSRAKLGRRIETDPSFPVLRCGTQGGGWLFDLGAVTAHLAQVPAVQRLGQPVQRAQTHPIAGDPRSTRAELEHIRAIERSIGLAVRKLNVALDRLAAATNPKDQ
ncbi:hypothetical protein ABH944_007795 [Caballeronia udeis]|uniref:Phage transcriptional regulator AlpA n=1 Tax=Caballeronia udeis TaxID=1232866 RepID=A0ABW8MVM7_9BURK